MFCPNCGTGNAEGAKFCANCGLEMAEKTNQTPAAGQAQPQQPYNVQPPYNNQIPYGQPNYNQHTKAPGSTAANSSIICALVCLATFAIIFLFDYMLFFGIVFGITAIVQGAQAIKNGNSGAKATAGLVLGIISTLAWAVVWILYFLAW